MCTLRNHQYQLRRLLPVRSRQSESTWLGLSREPAGRLLSAADSTGQRLGMQGLARDAAEGPLSTRSAPFGYATNSIRAWATLSPLVPGSNPGGPSAFRDAKGVDGRSEGNGIYLVARSAGRFRLVVERRRVELADLFHGRVPVRIDLGHPLVGQIGTASALVVLAQDLRAPLRPVVLWAPRLE